MHKQGFLNGCGWKLSVPKNSRGKETIYLHRSGPLLENGLDRPKNRYGRYGFPGSYSISISTVGVDEASFPLKILFSLSLPGGGGRYFSVPSFKPQIANRNSCSRFCRKIAQKSRHEIANRCGSTSQIPNRSVSCLLDSKNRSKVPKLSPRCLGGAISNCSVSAFSKSQRFRDAKAGSPRSPDTWAKHVHAFRVRTPNSTYFHAPTLPPLFGACLIPKTAEGQKRCARVIAAKHAKSNKQFFLSGVFRVVCFRKNPRVRKIFVCAHFMGA